MKLNCASWLSLEILGDLTSYLVILNLRSKAAKTWLTCLHDTVKVQR